MNEIRKQLTLFVDDPSGVIEKVRAKYNPVQYDLIPAHITLCREDELTSLDSIIKKLNSIALKNPIKISLHKVERFAEGKGVFIPATAANHEFRELRKLALGQTELRKEQLPHITLMHPRNSSCTDVIFKEIKKASFPNEVSFSKISLIEQRNGRKWNVLQEFKFVL